MRFPFLTAIACFVACTTFLGCGTGSLGLDGPPKRIRIAPDDYHARWVGETLDGRLFFATYPFDVNLSDGTERNFLAIYFWNDDGSFAEAVIRQQEQTADDAIKLLEKFVSEQIEDNDDLRIREIEVAPFEVQRFGLTFGLVHTVIEGNQWVEVLPGNYMAFTPPWNGDYDT